MRSALAIIAFASVLPACAALGDPQDLSASTSAPTAADLSGREYVAMAAASDLYEIESSRLALERSQVGSVQQFARKMIAHHTETSARLADAARAAGLNPEPKLMPMQESMLAELRNTSGATFDRTYLAQQRRAHDMALALHSGFAAKGRLEPLRQVAQAAVPVVEEHIRELRTMP